MNADYGAKVHLGVPTLLPTPPPPLIAGTVGVNCHAHVCGAGQQTQREFPACLSTNADNIFQGHTHPLRVRPYVDFPHHDGIGISGQ